MSVSKEDVDKIMERKSETTSILSIILSAVKKASIVGIVYFAGYMQWSVAWFISPIVLFVIRDQWKKSSDRRRNIAKSAALASEKDVVLARLDDLPAWVFFPDIERAEWLNRIIKQVWPNVNHYARDLIRDSIQPALREKLEGYKLNGFKFERIILGTVPFRIGGVKVYDKNIARNEIVMDLDIFDTQNHLEQMFMVSEKNEIVSLTREHLEMLTAYLNKNFYAGDCDITFYLSGIKGGIRDFQLHGMLRVVMKPLITSIPLVGGLQVFFLNNPDIDFDLIGIADLLDMPGLSDILRRIVVETVASMMVLPNKFPIKLSDEIEAMELKAPEPEGVLRVHVVEAKNLMKKDISVLGKGKSDPYAVITLGAQEFKTKVIDNSVDPKWDFWCEFNVLESDGQQLYIHLWDKDETSDDETLGRATVEVSNIVKKGGDDMWITLEQAKHGMIHLRLTWLTLSEDYSDLKAALEETQLLRVTSMSTALLTIFIDSAKNLPQARAATKPDPYAVLKVGTTVRETNVVMRTIHPVWEQGYTFLVANPESDNLYLTIIDKKTTNELGQIVYQINKLSKKTKMEIYREPFSLFKSGPESKVVWSMHLRILKRCPGTEEVDSSEPPPEIIDTAKTEDIVPPTPEPKEDPITSVPPNVEETVQLVTALPLSSTPPKESSDLLRRTPSTTSSAGVHQLGRIQLTIRYSIQRQRLIVVVHKIANIPQKDPSNIPDPYVKLYLLPERSKDSKRKTQVVKDNCDPIFDETFEYVLSQGELHAKQLEVTVASQKQLFYSGSNILGMVVIDFEKLNVSQPYTSWFDLNPESEYEH